MKLARLGEPGHERPVLITDTAVFDLSGLIGDLDPDSIADGAIEKIRAAAASGCTSRDRRRSRPAHRRTDRPAERGAVHRPELRRARRRVGCERRRRARCCS